jgi:hypothetical protein
MGAVRPSGKRRLERARTVYVRPLGPRASLPDVPGVPQDPDPCPPGGPLRSVSSRPEPAAEGTIPPSLLQRADQVIG